MAVTDSVFYAFSGFITPLTAIFIWYLLHKKLSKLRETKTSFLILFSLLAWVSLSHWLGSLDIFKVHSYVVPFIAFGMPYIFSQVLSRSQALSKAVDSLPNHLIILAQVFRLLGVLFILLYLEGLMPAEFAIPSGVGDVIAGITAPVVAYLYYKRAAVAKAVALWWNYFGILDLTIAMIAGPLTAPTLVQVLALNNPNDLILSYPLVTIPTFAVPFSFILHIISLRLLKKK